MAMTLNDFLEKFREQFFDHDEISLDPRTEFRRIESYDSLTGMALIAMIKDNFGVDIDDERWKQLRTVEEVFDHIQNRLR
jgi:acyl carrier protein